MSKTLFSGLLALGLVACSTGVAKENEVKGNAASGNGPSVAAAPAQRTLASGTRIGATIQDSLSSRRDKAGHTFAATTSGDVKDAGGHVVIPEGSAVELMIGELEPASSRSADDGKISLSVTSITVRGQVYRVSASLEPVQHHLQGRGVTASKVATVGVGAAAGAIAGKLIGKNTKGAVIGGAIGAGAGTAAAVQAGDRDVVVNRGTPILFSLTQSLSVSTR